MSTTEAPEAGKPDISEAEKNRRRILRDLGNLCTFFLIATGLNILTIAETSITVGCALGVFTSLGVSRYYRSKKVWK